MSVFAAAVLPASPRRFSLAERGYSVVVLEQNRIGWGASGRNGRQVIGGFSGEALMAKRLGEVAADPSGISAGVAIPSSPSRWKKYAIDCDFKYGYMDVASAAPYA